MSGTIPVTLIGGYLGAGKTTLVNHLLRNANGRRLAVLVNEFGELPIDADLIVAREDDLISISGGCICCSFGSDLLAALMQLKDRGDVIDHLLIETSGVALPASIVQSLSLLPDLVLDGVIVVADAETIEARARDRYMGDTVLAQLAHADIILLNKADLVSPERFSDVSRWLGETVPRARVVPAENADIPLEIIVGQHAPRQGDTRLTSRSGRQHIADYETLSFGIDAPRDPERLAAALAAMDCGLLRAKGFVRRIDGTFATVHVVGRRALVEPAPDWIEGPGRLVCIGLANQINRSAIEAAVEASSIVIAENVP
jgi:G3E family GTPase